MDLVKDYSNILQGGAVGLVSLAVLKLVSNKKLYAFGNMIGTMITAGLSKFPAYQKFEDFVVNGIDVLVQGFIHGLRSDDSKENARNRDAEKDAEIKAEAKKKAEAKNP